jgi:lysophospholipase L1-like esterase
MQATHGFAVSFRTRGRLIGFFMGLLMGLAALVLAPVVAHAQEPATTTYLSLGDSISFGYTEERFNNHFPTESPSYFEEGFTNDLAKSYLAKPTEIGKSIRLVNDACPGETSNGLIGENPAVLGEASTESYAQIEQKPEEDYELWYGGFQSSFETPMYKYADWHPCKYAFQDHLPLHNGGYFNAGKEVSQLEEALASIASAKSPVKLITLNIGSNDELAGITECKDEVFYEFATKGKSQYGNTPEFAVLVCIQDTTPNTVAHILHNIGDTLGVIDGDGYKGPIVLMGFYNPDSFVLPGSDELQESVNAAIEADVVPLFANVTYANPFPVFNHGAETKTKKENAVLEQKSICTYTEMCNPNDPGGKEDNGDIHPTVDGYKQLAKLANEAYLANPAK